MITKLLIANRGEIVSRIIRTCRRLGVATVAVYSEADREAAYVKQADEAVLIGPANPVQSYLNIESIVEAARQTGAEAIHPGYGFLSERGAFAEAVTEAGFFWVGPSSQILRAISSKTYCRHLAAELDVPVIPGTLDPVRDVAEVTAFGREHGYPIFLKLDKGGGGKGIEIIHSEDQAAEVFERATSIGQMAFGSPDCYIEKVVTRPRHIEVQFLADTMGHCVCLGERECSVQRRHQKIIEESPSTVVTDEDRARIFDYTRRLVLKMGYHGAGTIESLRSGEGDYYFMEINARLQVEHPVTEFITGIDIVQKQLEISAGEELGLTQEEIKREGYAIEARVYAEDPETFFPSPGTITRVSFPKQGPNLRIDHALADNLDVPPYYDPMLAKVIAWESTRDRAARRLVEALDNFEIEGVKTTIPLNLEVLQHPSYLSGDYDTGFVDQLFKERGD